MTSQTLPGEVDGLLKNFDDLDLEGDIPAEVMGLMDSSDDEAKSKAAAAFGQLRTTLKTAKGVIGQMSEQLKEKEKPPEQEVSPSSSVSVSQQSQFYLNQLQVRAMQVLGLQDPTNPLVQLEVQRLYNVDAAMAQQQLEAKDNAATVVEETLSKFPHLDDEDRGKIREDLSKMAILDQASPDRVKLVVLQYMGANIEKLAAKVSKAPPSPPSNNGNPTSTADVSPGAAAASSVKSQGSKGVELGTGPALGKPGEGEVTKPASDQERKRMKGVGLDPTNLVSVATFRVAEKKKSKYAQS